MKKMTSHFRDNTYALVSRAITQANVGAHRRQERLKRRLTRMVPQQKHFMQTDICKEYTPPLLYRANRWKGRCLTSECVQKSQF